MHPGTGDPHLAALTATLKAMARWAPHARHDVVGACSPISLDLSVLSAKSVKAALSTEDIRPFVERSKANVKNTVQKLDHIVMLQRQDRTLDIAVCDVMERMAHAMRTVFVEVTWSPPADPVTLGTDAEYDLTIAIWAALMALLDQYGASMHLAMKARREEGQLFLSFSITPTVVEAVAPAANAPLHMRIGFDEVRHLAAHLGFAFGQFDGGIELRRSSAMPVALHDEG